MRAFIGNSLISKLQPKDKQYDVRDSKLSGFLIRVTPTGKMTYVCQYKRGRRINLGSVDLLTPAQARDKALAILGEAAKGIFPHDNRPDNNITLKSFIENHYKPWFIAHRKSGQKTIDHINRCFTVSFGNMLLNELTPSFTDNWRTQRLNKGKSKETVNRDIATLKSALTKAVLWGLIEKHPLEKFKLLKSDRSIKVRYLARDEEVRLRDALLSRETRIKNERESGNKWRKSRNQELLPDIRHLTFADHLRPMILLSINTGMRRGELFSLKWSNINFEQAMLTIDGAYAKSGKTRHIPLNSEALSVLKSWRKQTNTIDLVFPSKDGNQFNNNKKSWKNILTEAKITKFRWHDMRHHFASKLVMAGVDLNTVRELLGHAEMTMTLRYAHLAPEHKALAVEKIVNTIEVKKAV